MRKDFERCHIIAKGSGTGCDCSANILILTPYEHDILDRRILHQGIKHWIVHNQEAFKGYKLSHHHKIAFGVLFGYSKEIEQAILHYRLRNRGKTSCTKIIK